MCSPTSRSCLLYVNRTERVWIRVLQVAYFHPVTEKALNGRQWNVTDGCLQSRESYLVHQESEHEDLLFGVHVVVTIKGTQRMVY